MSLFTVDSANIITQSYLDIHNEVCPICRCNITDKCLDCANSIENIVCTSVLGECNHAYHIHCIQTWLKTKKICPLDNKTWVFMKHSCNANKNNKCNKRQGSVAVEEQDENENEDEEDE